MRPPDGGGTTPKRRKRGDKGETSQRFGRGKRRGGNSVHVFLDWIKKEKIANHHHSKAQEGQGKKDRGNGIALILGGKGRGASHAIPYISPKLSFLLGAKAAVRGEGRKERLLGYERGGRNR